MDKLLRAGEGRMLRKLKAYADQVDTLEEDFESLSDAELREETDRFRKRIEDGEKLDLLLPEAFAAVREADKRTSGQRAYPVQLMGGAAIHLGNIAEMKTGEGKTKVAAFAAYLNALSGKGVHVITVNDYLAEYQSDIVGRIHRMLGVSAGCILDGQTPAERRIEYAKDITYGTNTQFGFDYLRDNMAWQASERVQREHNFSIVDEVDSILIDEARTPLIISGPAEGQADKWFVEFSKVVRKLKRDRDYEIDEKKRTIAINESGIERVEDYLGINNLYESANATFIGFLSNSIKAKELFKRDKDYVVVDGEILIVDEHTGRTLPGRRYSEGVHQAIEAKEGVEIQAENQTLATITLQNYFRLYDKLGGMTGTAVTEAGEFMSTYKLGVVPIPTNRPIQRIDQTDVVYRHEVAKFDAVVEDLVERHEKKQPVLVGTTSVEKSEYLSKKLKERGVKHEVLNAKQHAREAAVVAMAGRSGAVTVATNMAGRGTDIMLGGNEEFLAMAEMERRGLDPEENSEEFEAQWDKVYEDCKEKVAEDRKKVLEAGGLYVLGTERHESRRIDNQLRGRSGRQGDPGESRFYLSLNDELMMRSNQNATAALMDRAGVSADTPLEFKMLSSAIERAQTTIEGQNAEIRKNILKYDDVMNRQRTVIYGERGRVLDGEDVHQQISHFIPDVVSDVVYEVNDEGPEVDIDMDKLFAEMNSIYPVSFSVDELLDQLGGRAKVSLEGVTREFTSDMEFAYKTREDQVGGEALRELERRVLLSVLDRNWREHLYEMDYLQEGISLRSMAQKDPLVEFQREGYSMYQDMIRTLKRQTMEMLFHAEVEAPAAEPGADLPITLDAAGQIQVNSDAIGDTRPDEMQLSGPTADGGVEAHRERRDGRDAANRAQRRAKQKDK